jgi:hypothetical protein
MSREPAARCAWIVGAFVSLLLVPRPAWSQEAPTNSFTVVFCTQTICDNRGNSICTEEVCENPKNKLGLTAAKLNPNISVPPGSTLNLSNPDKSKYKWDYLGIVSIAYAWENDPSWENFTTLNFTGSHLSSQSLGATPPPSGKPEHPNLKDLFASASFKVTTLIMDNVEFTPTTTSRKTFVKALAELLSVSTTLKTVSLAGPLTLNKPQFKKLLREKCPKITFKF